MARRGRKRQLELETEYWRLPVGANARQVRFIAPAKLIDARPAEVAKRSRVGDWEGDLIVGPGSRSAIGTLVGRRSRYLLLVHLPDGHSATACRQALQQRISELPGHLDERPRRPKSPRCVRRA